jgi:hypothetical protein
MMTREIKSRVAITQPKRATECKFALQFLKIKTWPFHPLAHRSMTLQIFSIKLRTTFSNNSVKAFVLLKIRHCVK